MTAATLADLRQVPLFAALRDDELESIVPLFTVRAYAKNAIVFSEGEYLSEVFFVLSGKTRHFWRDERLDGHARYKCESKVAPLHPPAARRARCKSDKSPAAVLRCFGQLQPFE